MHFSGWLLLLHALPTRRNSLRVNVWRKLRRAGAVALKTSASLLPDTPEHHEQFQWLAKQIRDGGGEATLVRTPEIEDLSPDQLARLFNDARAGDYAALARDLTDWRRRRGQRRGGADDPELERLRARFAEIQKIDFFDCPRAHDARMLLEKAATGGRAPRRPAPLLQAARYRGKTWLTRPRPQVDRAASAWLIQRVIDPQARFLFAPRAADHPGAVAYDMADAELTHQGDDCTFETLLKRFALRERPLARMAEMVHDADLHDDKFQAPGAEGIDRVLEGLGRLGWSDERILRHGIDCFEALYAQVKAS